MDELSQKIEYLLKSLLSLKQNTKRDFFVPAIKTPSLPKPTIKQPSKIPSALPPPSKKDPVKVAQQLKNPNPGKVQMEVLKVEDNGQWSLTKGTENTTLKPSSSSIATKMVGTSTPRRTAKVQTSRAPIDATEGFANHHSPEQSRLIHGLDFHNATPMRGSVAGAAKRASNPSLGKDAVIKRASAHANQEQRGHLDNGFNSSKREVLFHNMANNFFGMGKHVPTTAGFSRDGEDYSAQEFQPGAKHADLMSDDTPLTTESANENAFEAKKEMDEFKHPNHVNVLNNLHSSGDLHKLALMDNIMGHHDRHGGNYMMDDKGNNLHLIDNGTAFDYKNFDTHPYPAYMRHVQDANIKGMGRDNTEVHPEAAKWLNSLDPEKAKEILAQHGHDENSSATQGMLRRLQGMKSAVNNGPEHYKNMDNLLGKNRLTSGPLYPHKKVKPQW